MAATGAATENRELVPNKFAAAIGEDRRALGETCPVLLVTAGGKPFDETFICQHAGADRWTVASGGIAQAAAHKNMIPISPGMERCLKKLVLEAEVTGFQDPEKGGWEPVGPSGRKTVPGGHDWRLPGVYS